MKTKNIKKLWTEEEEIGACANCGKPTLYSYHFCSKECEKEALDELREILDQKNDLKIYVE